MQSILEFTGFLTQRGQTRHETVEGFLPVRRLLSNLGFYLLQTDDADGAWTCAYRSWSDGCSVDCQTAAPVVFFGKVSHERTGFVLPHGHDGQAFLCGIPWPKNQIGILGGDSRFGLRIPAGTRLRLVFHTACPGDPGSARTPAFLEADPNALLQIENSVFPPDGLVTSSDSDPLTGVSLLQNLEGRFVSHPRSAQRDCEFVGAALDIFMADLTNSPSPRLVARRLGVSAHTLELASLAVTSHSLEALHRLVCWNSTLFFFKEGRKNAPPLPHRAAKGMEQPELAGMF
jgi:hypothetical protein